MMKTMQRPNQSGRIPQRKISSLALNPVTRDVWEFNRVTHLPGSINDIVRVHGVCSQTNRKHQSLGTELHILRSALRITIDMVCTIEGTQLVISTTQKRTETVFTVKNKDGTKSTVKRAKSVSQNSVTINRLHGVELDVSKFNLEGMMAEMEKVFHPDNLQLLLQVSTAPVEKENFHQYHECSEPAQTKQQDSDKTIVLLPINITSESSPSLQVK